MVSQFQSQFGLWLGRIVQLPQPLKDGPGEHQRIPDLGHILKQVVARVGDPRQANVHGQHLKDISEYSGDLKSGNIWNPNFLRVGFEMVPM